MSVGKKEFIHRKNAEAISAAKVKGVRFGAPEIPVPDNFDLIVDMWNSREITLRDAAKRCDMPYSTFYYKAKSIRIKNELSYEMDFILTSLKVHSIFNVFILINYYAFRFKPSTLKGNVAAEQPDEVQLISLMSINVRKPYEIVENGSSFNCIKGR